MKKGSYASEGKAARYMAGVLARLEEIDEALAALAHPDACDYNYVLARTNAFFAGTEIRHAARAAVRRMFAHGTASAEFGNAESGEWSVTRRGTLVHKAGFRPIGPR
jgi:hypothetical protein